MEPKTSGTRALSTNARRTRTATLALAAALALATTLFGCAQEEMLPNETRIDAASFRYPDTVQPTEDEPSSSTVRTEEGFSYKEKHLDFRNDERTFFFGVHLCENVSYDDALSYAKAATHAMSSGEISENEAALLEKYRINPDGLPAVAHEAPQEAEVGGRAAFTQISTAARGDKKAVRFVQGVEAGENAIVYLDAYLPEQTFLENEDALRAVGQSIRVEEPPQG